MLLIALFLFFMVVQHRSAHELLVDRQLAEQNQRALVRQLLAAVAEVRTLQASSHLRQLQAHQERGRRVGSRGVLCAGADRRRIQPRPLPGLRGARLGSDSQLNWG